MLARLLPGADHLQNPHPLAVHFPIAFLYGAALLYFVAWLSRRDSIAWAALWFLVLGLITAAIALGTGGWRDARSIGQGERVGTAQAPDAGDLRHRRDPDAVGDRPAPDAYFRDAV